MKTENIQNIFSTVPLSVKGLSNQIKGLLEENFTHVCVQGEVSGFKHHTSGHRYFSLKDDEAVIDAICWRGGGGTRSHLLQDGLEVIAHGRLTTYGGRSKYQLIVEDIEPTGQGALLKLLEDRKQLLAAEGLFDASRKRPLPLFPQVIGVITSLTGAVIQDILHRVQDRYPCHVIVWPVAVQGDGAALQIAQAIEGFNTLCPFPPQVIIVARGGGSIEDLWVFNEEIVVRAAAASHIPLISAVGHETDVTLIDFAADQRAPTPTAAAELAVPVLREVHQAVMSLDQRLHQAASQCVKQKEWQLEALRRGLTHPNRLLDTHLQRLEDWSQRLNMAFSHHLRHQEQQVEALEHHLYNLSYQRTLERGFCMAVDTKGHLLPNQKAFKEGAPFTLYVRDGHIQAIPTRVPPTRPVSSKPPSIHQTKLF